MLKCTYLHILMQYLLLSVLPFPFPPKRLYSITCLLKLKQDPVCGKTRDALLCLPFKKGVAVAVNWKECGCEPPLAVCWSVTASAGVLHFLGKPGAEQDGYQRV